MEVWAVAAVVKAMEVGKRAQVPRMCGPNCALL